MIVAEHLRKSVSIADYIRESHETAKSKGWWGEPERSFGDQIALMHSELSEALEEYRRWGLTPADILRKGQANQCSTDINESGWIHKPEGIAAEFADVLIRIFDTCGRYGIPLEEALRLKMAYNKTRPHKHGGKVI